MTWKFLYSDKSKNRYFINEMINRKAFTLTVDAFFYGTKS